MPSLSPGGELYLIRGDWADGERIPPERELCHQLGVGRASLREAMKALAHCAAGL